MTPSILLEETLGDLLDGDGIDFGNLSSILVDLFEGVVLPDVFLTHSNRVAVQQVFSVRVSTSIDYMHSHLNL